MIVPGIDRLQEVGRGGGGVVLAGWQAEFGRWVAVKVFPTDSDARRLERERLAVGALSDHPGIVPVLGGGVTDDGRPYLVMPYMDGGSLADRVAAHGVLDPQQAVTFGTTMAAALQVAHDHGILHRDLKPANILYDRFGSPRLADFGIAHLGSDGFRTEAGLVSGTIAYMAPELLDGRAFTPAADVYSLGCTLYYALEGRHLFTPRPDEVLSAFVMRRLGAPHAPEFSPRVPQALRDVVLAATHPDPAYRIPTAAALAEALRRAGAEPAAPYPAPSAPVAPAPPPPPPPYGTMPPAGTGPVPAARARSGGPVALVAAGVAAVVLAAVVGGVVMLRGWSAGLTTSGTATPSIALPTDAATPATDAATAATSGATAASAPAGTSGGASGAAAVQQAVAAFRTSAGGGDPLALELVFYPYQPTGAYAIATLPQAAHPALADRWTFRNGQVGDREPLESSSDTAANKRFTFSKVTWSATDSMLRTADKVCRAAMTKAGLPDETDSFGRKAGITHVIVERDVDFNAGAVVVRVYFSGGARWSGGYVLFAASGKLLDPSYCDVR